MRSGLVTLGLGVSLSLVGLSGCVVEAPRRTTVAPLPAEQVSPPAPPSPPSTTAGGATTRPASPGSRPPTPATSPLDRTRIYVANESSNSVTVIDGARYTVLATVEALNRSTHDLALSRDGRTLLATNLASGRLSVIDTMSMETVASVYTGARSHVVAFTNDDRHAWVANIGEDNVSVVEIASLRILGTIPTGKGPTGLAFSRDGRFAYVSNQGDKTVAVVDTATLTVVKRRPSGRTRTSSPWAPTAGSGVATRDRTTSSSSPLPFRTSSARSR